MKPSSRYADAILHFDSQAYARAVFWRAGPVRSVSGAADGSIALLVPFSPCLPGQLTPDPAGRERLLPLRVAACGPRILRISLHPGGARPLGTSPMLVRAPATEDEPLRVRISPDSWEVRDREDRLRLRIPRSSAPVQPWSTLVPPPEPEFTAELFPDGRTAVPFSHADTFTPERVNSWPLGFVEAEGTVRQVSWALHARHDEHFGGTGERFARMNLAGGTYVLENADALGVNNRRAYKNVPFYVSSRGYGLLAHTSAHVLLSLADVSTRAAIGAAESAELDLFVIGGGSVETIVRGYRELSGFPPPVPRWSFGVWMSRMTYFTADECEAIARRLRAEDFPCDVLHLDTGWFRTDWKCEWEFSPERFPDPAGFMARLRLLGFRTTLWQTPWVAEGTLHHAEARARAYIVTPRPGAGSDSDLSSHPDRGNHPIDFSNPEAVEWYQGLLARLLRLGASAIKTDFGEFLDPSAAYHGLPYSLLHNLYPVLYQRAAWDITAAVTGEPILWARSAWTGCQRYPVHWGGDSAATWDGLAASLRGGIHLGLSGFAHWSHDVPGFHGSPDFMNSRPTESLYLRWTQAAVFGSHLRYHGTCPREPWEYPGVAALVRSWWKLRYALIPYLAACGLEASTTGFPLLRALVFHHGDDPACWSIDDQFYCGPDLLVAPILDESGTRSVYLPEGEWVDFWSGESFAGGRWLRALASPPAHIPVFARRGARLPYYPESIACTDEMQPGTQAWLNFDATYRGLARSPLGPLTGLG